MRTYLTDENIQYRERKNIKRQSLALAYERLKFRNGEKLSDILISIEGGATRRKVRRIIEKRVCQNYWKNSHRESAANRFKMKRFISNQMKNIYGRVPIGFFYAA